MSLVLFLEEKLKETLVLKQTPTNAMVRSFNGKDFLYISSENFAPERITLEADYNSGQSVNILYFTKTLSPIDILREMKCLHDYNDYNIRIVSCRQLPELFTEYDTYSVNILINQTI